ncbi:MAG: hypothetical protein ACYDDQ_05495 [Vulcanimicrobiaceae bacterium]
MMRSAVLAIAVTAAVAFGGCAGVRAAAQPPAPAGPIPAHVMTYLYYSAANQNEGVPAAYMAAHADFIETDATHPGLVRAFKAAGGRFAVAYTDPTYVPYCTPPFAPPAGRCAGPIGNQVLAESAWLHGSDGLRLRRGDAYTHQYQEILNPASVYAQAAYHNYTLSLAESSPIDFFFADDSGSPLDGPDGTPHSGLFYRFNGAATEIAGARAWIAGEDALLNAAARPVIINGGGPEGAPAYGGAFLRDPNVIGQNHEDCFSQEGSSGLMSARDRVWQKMENGLLAVTRMHVYAICMMKGPPTPANRIYALASWWLTYDPHWSVAATVVPAPDGHSIFPEYAIVPREPVQTIGTNISTLRQGGVYVREFAACYQDRVPIGRCAAVVNPSPDAPSAMPRLTVAYGLHLVLGRRSAFAGGRAAWQAGVPGVLAPLSALILRE